MAELASAAPTSGGVSHSSFVAMIYILTYMWDIRDGYDISSSTIGPTRSPHLDRETCLLGLSAVSSCLRLIVSRYSLLCSSLSLGSPSTNIPKTVSNLLSSFPGPYLLSFLYPILPLLC